METTGLDEVLNDIELSLKTPDLIQDNKLNFEHKDSLYRVRMPNQREYSLAESKKNELYGELIQIENMMTKPKLKKILKEKQNIDLDALQKEADDLEKEMYDVYISLSRKKDSETEAIEKYKKQIQDITVKRRDILMEITGHYESTIESQIENRYMEFLTACCTEKYFEEDKKGRWEKVWSNFDEYTQDDTKLPLKAVGYLTHLIFAIRD